jgi:hypothetical protein
LLCDKEHLALGVLLEYRFYHLDPDLLDETRGLAYNVVVGEEGLYPLDIGILGLCQGLAFELGVLHIVQNSGFELFPAFICGFLRVNPVL